MQANAPRSFKAHCRLAMVGPQGKRTVGGARFVSDPKPGLSFQRSSTRNRATSVRRNEIGRAIRRSSNELRSGPSAVFVAVTNYDSFEEPIQYSQGTSGDER